MIGEEEGGGTEVGKDEVKTESATDKKQRWLPGSHPDVQKKIKEVRARGEAKRKAMMETANTENDIMDQPIE